MDHLVDKELAAWLHSEGCSQQLGVQVDTSDKWCFSGFGMRTGLRSEPMWRKAGGNSLPGGVGVEQGVMVLNYKSVGLGQT